MVTPDELDPMGELQIITTVNGEERQNDTTANIIFPFRYLISYLSKFYHLKPGDIIATGTPNGAGARSCAARPRASSRPWLPRSRPSHASMPASASSWSRT